jgi:hypothetical protein
MARGLRAQALLALALGAAGNWHPAAAVEYRCRNGDSVRLIELSGPESTQGAACEVRYWRNADAPGTGQSLWRANRDTDFCAARARELIARLEAGGWTCDASAQPEAAAPVLAAGSEPELAARTEPPSAAAAPAQIGRAPEPEPAEATLPSRSPSAAVAPTAPAPVRMQPRSHVVARSDPSGSDEPPAAATADANAILLDRIVEQTLHSAQELYGGQFQAELPAFGDLDEDGRQDAVVLITHQTDRDEYVQYLVAYLFNGEMFQSVATRNVGGRFLDAARAHVQGIADGQILVELESPAGGAACCARRRAAFALQGGQLVEVEDPGAPSLERTSGAETPSPG